MRAHEQARPIGEDGEFTGYSSVDSGPGFPSVRTLEQRFADARVGLVRQIGVGRQGDDAFGSPGKGQAFFPALPAVSCHVHRPVNGHVG